MAPVPEPSILTTLSNLLRRTPSPPEFSTPFSELSPKAAALIARAKNLVPRKLDNPGAGVVPPQNVPNKAFFALFALIGVGFVVTGIWFFFWAKNGGFYFREDDWDDYKSTVLRRKGPNGTTLSGATESTDLGGGSIVHGEGKSRWGRKNKKGRKADSRYKDFEDEASTLNGSIDGTVLSSEMSEVKWKNKEAYKAKKDKKPKKKSRFGRGENHTEDRNLDEEEMDVGVADTIRAYRHEKPARVGGLNKQADGSAFDGSTQDGSSAASDLLSHREKTPTSTPTKVKKERNDKYTGGTGGAGGIRKVVSTSQPAASSSFWNRSSSTRDDESERIKAEAKKLQDKGRAAQRRDFSFQVGDDVSSSAPTSTSGRTEGDEDRRARREERRRRREEREREKMSVPGTYYEESEMGSELSGDIGTKSYHHPIPGLSSGTGGGASDYAEERRKKRGYRRGD